ncbi:esterase-5B-like isoform X2 [Haematobia irritans]|uniref:esterase-5B-like isoform X2 n=1 Tax=Haematobia irritans TaxID=7368 RepID=UPI003F5043B0
MKFKHFVGATILFGLFCVSWSLSEDPLLIKIHNGLLRGRDRGFYYSYESIPYAKAPVGKLRFETPQPYDSQWNEIFDATREPLPCMQWDQLQVGENKLRGVEDCLQLNIYKPKTGKSKYPVMVFIHGGCFMFGNARDPQPDYLMANGNIILVKIQYRIGPLGFLSTEDDIIPGNYGLKDQQMALQWIHRQIKHFGGDPKKIILTGFSAGGASTHLHVLQPHMEDIIKTAVAFSGVALNPWVITRNARSKAFELAHIMGCPSSPNTENIKECLQQKSADDIVSSTVYFQNIGYNPFTIYGPVVEHRGVQSAFLTQHPRDIIDSGKYGQIPFLVSYTSEDGGYNAAELLAINPKTGHEFIYDLNEHWLDLAPENLFLCNIVDQPQEYAAVLREAYLGPSEFSVNNYWKVQELYTDILYRIGILETLRRHSQTSSTPIYSYVYDNPADRNVGFTLSNRTDIEFGTNHLDDLSLIMHYPIRSKPRQDEEIISDKFIKMLVDFVETEHLAFGECEFEKNNVDSGDDLKILWIGKDSCKTIVE